MIRKALRALVGKTGGDLVVSEQKAPAEGYVDMPTPPENKEILIPDGNIRIVGGLPKGAKVQVVRGNLWVVGDIAEGAQAHSWYGDVLVDGHVHELAAVNSLKLNVAIHGDVHGAMVKAGELIAIDGDVTDSTISNVKDAREKGASDLSRKPGITISGYASNSKLLSDGDIMIGKSVSEKSRAASSFGSVVVGGDVTNASLEAPEHDVYVDGEIGAGATVQCPTGSIHTRSVSHEATVTGRVALHADNPLMAAIAGAGTPAR